MMPKDLARQCFQPWTSLNVSTDGKVYPCCVIHKDLMVGDVSAQVFNDIVHGAAMIRLKEKMLSGEIADLPCAGCPNGPLSSPEEFQDAVARLFFAPESAPSVAAPSNALAEREANRSSGRVHSSFWRRLRAILVG